MLETGQYIPTRRSCGGTGGKNQKCTASREKDWKEKRVVTGS